MSTRKKLQLYRGDTAKNDAYTGVIGELTYDSTVKGIRIHDGITQGGFKLANLSDLVAIGTLVNDIGPKLYNNLSLGDYVLEDNRNEALVNPITFNSITIGTNSTLKLI